MFGALKGQKEALNPLEMGLQTVVSALWVLGIKPSPFARTVNVLNSGTISQALMKSEQIRALFMGGGA